MPQRGTPHSPAHSTAPAGGRGLALSASRGRLSTHVSQYDLSPHGAHEACAALFLYEVERRGLRWVERVTVPRTDIALGDLESIGRVELSWRAAEAHDAFLSLDGDMLALITSRSGSVEVSVAGRAGEPVHDAAKRVSARLRSEPPVDERLVVLFWASTPHGGAATRRELDAPAWSDVAGGYTRAARGEMDRLVALRDPAGGSLLLWHGPPGTGKSHALRALALEWREWCSVHYVTDPEAFLGAGTQYLMQVASWGAPDPDDDDDESESRRGPQWRLIVLEDAGELMAADARASSGQGLSRLLNLTDGLLGQGARCLLLVTTNEPLGRMHPAVRRPGRCLSVIEFAPLAAGEANAWLAARGRADVVEHATTLAELYAIAEERPRPEGEASGAGSGAGGFGFGRAIG